MRATPPPRPIRRLRRCLVWVGILTALLIAAACRLDTAGRVIASIGAVAGLALWCALLDAEGRACERLEARSHRRSGSRSTARSARPRPVGRRRRAA
ncbi:hypothetical protein [Cognatilysobacter segetis]|uniref:hypothetical protein n=1 Tax=Cognatilysobacter segetis TaxID=2492394 RepID=UPI001061A02C|nr:hypothetical protein [Lysobacter segetis]